MTSEVCLLNRFAAVLAADSATTVSHWDSDRQRTVERYFKGANKIFQLSAHHPVGLMIYENISLHSVPWEILAKEFRAEIKGMACASPRAYAMAFFDFLRAAEWLFPEAILNDHTRSQAFLAALSVLWGTDGEVAHDPQNADQRRNLIRQRFETRRADLAAKPIPQPFSPED